MDDADRLTMVRQQIWAYYQAHGRHDLPWRQFESDGQLDPYKVVVSELMLQQTQVPRVVPKFETFVEEFPTFKSLASAPLADVLRAWSGLGYNRRAKFLWQTAQAIVSEHAGQLPATRELLTRLPGIGPNTAGAILAYAFNQPAVFVETNIRTVFIHSFFADEPQVTDVAIVALLETMLVEVSDPRMFYWALMDYGTRLKQTVGNAARQSVGYTRQSAFAGSRRQVRGQVLRALAEGSRSNTSLAKTVTDERLPEVIDDLLREGMIAKDQAGTYRLP